MASKDLSTEKACPIEGTLKVHATTPKAMD